MPSIKTLVTVLCLTVPCCFGTQAQSLPRQCTIVYALDGLAYAAFNTQITTLEQHLVWQNVGLIDLNQWQTQKPHIPTSGRKRAMLRRQFAFATNQDYAVLLDKQGKVLQRYESTVDLVDMLLTCNGSEPDRHLFNQRYADTPRNSLPNG